MNPTTPLRPRNPRRLSRSRAFLEKVFPFVAFCATFFGLVMLVVFFVRIGIDVSKWFQTMPQLVEQQNEHLEARLKQAGDFDALIATETRIIDQQMAEELATAAEKNRPAIRKNYEKIKAHRLDDLKSTVREIVQEGKSIRPNISASAMLGHFFVNPPSNQPQDAGILPALLGSILIGLITLACAVPLGLGAAVYLEEYRSSSRLARIIQININNLAGVPSVVYGILGAYLFVELIFKPLESGTIAARNLLGGGLTLALLTLPVIIIATQESLRAVPVSLRHAAIALGATRWQVVRGVVLPAALPGIMTGIILAMSRALGEAAPLILFGALLYVNHLPTLFSRFSVLPMQIFDWAGRPNVVWQYNAALASAVLMIIILGLNAAAIYLRQKAQKNLKW